MLPECTHTGPGSHECICHPGYDSKDNGTNYAAIAECDSNPCQNNATCVRRDQEMKLEAALLHLDESRVAHDEAEEVAAKEEVRLIEAAAHADVEGIDHEEHLGLKLSVSNRVQQRLLFQHQRELRPPSKPLFLFPTHHPCKDKFSLCIKIQQWAATTTRSDHTARIGVPNTREQCGVQGCVPFLISHQVRVPIFVSPLLACAKQRGRCQSSQCPARYPILYRSRPSHRRPAEPGTCMERRVCRRAARRDTTRGVPVLERGPWAW